MKYLKLLSVINAVMLLALLAITAPPAPARAAGETVALSASQGAIGQVITVTGSGFFASNTTQRGVIMMFGKHPGSATMNYSTVIHQRLNIIELPIPNGTGKFTTTFIVPSALNSGTTKEAVTQGTYYLFFTYYYADYSPPLDSTDILVILPFTVATGSITVSPTSGTPGTEVSISGAFMGINDTIGVKYDGFAASVTGDTTTDGSGAFGVAKLTIPAGTAGSHVITVTGTAAGITAQANFTVKPAIALTPSNGAAGTNIVLTGAGFTGNSEITVIFDNQPLTPGNSDVNGSVIMNAVALKRAPGNYTVTATDKNGNSATATFVVTATSFNISPTTGAAGTLVNASGTNFAASRAITVTFNEATIASAVSDARGGFSVNFTVPSLPGGTYKVQAADGTNTSAAFDFIIPATASISPQTSLATPANIGTDVNVSGSGFSPGGTVTITYDGRQVAIASVNADRSFSTSFKVPTSAAGVHVVVATDGVNSRQFNLFVESTPPPTPAPLKPDANVRTSPETFFDWADVNDPSGGVTYALQVATRDDFSAGAIVLDKIGLESSEYSIPAAQALKAAGKDAPYFWHVRAIDGAGNMSEWSDRGTFIVGGGISLPQPMIYILIGIGVIVLLVIAFFVGKKTAYY